MTETLSLSELNGVDKDTFIAILGGIFEHSPWVAEQVYGQQPFADVSVLHQAMVAKVKDSNEEMRKRLICSHPELAGKEAEEGGFLVVKLTANCRLLTLLTADSKSEQSSAGLDQCTTQEFARLKQLNAAYRGKFSFPFIIAVRGRNRHEIMEDMEIRLNNSPEVEFDRCIEEIARIAELRLEGLIGDN